MEPQPIDIPADVPRGSWWSNTFANDVTGYRYRAVVPTFGPAHFHSQCWCGERVEPETGVSLELVFHQDPPN